MREYFQSVERSLFDAAPRRSIPIKSIGFKASVLSPARSGSCNGTSREATALLIAAKSHGLALQPGQAVPRAFMLSEREWIIENGCGQDIIQSGFAEIDAGPTPESDRFILSARFIHWIETRAGRERVHAFMTSPVPPQLTQA